MKLRDDLILRQMGEDFVIVDPSQDVIDMSKVFTLNETAAFIWRELEGEDFTEETIAKILIEHYDIEYSSALVDAGILIEQFVNENLLEG